MTQKFKTMTDSQKRGFLWLPADGSWSKDAKRDVSAALKSLVMYHPDMAEEMRLVTQFGRMYLARRLTPAGVSERAALEAALGEKSK